MVGRRVPVKAFLHNLLLTMALITPLLTLSEMALATETHAQENRRTLQIAIPEAGDSELDPIYHEFLQRMFETFAESSNYRVEFRPYEFGETDYALRSGKADLIALDFFLADRAHERLYSIPFLTLRSKVWTRHKQTADPAKEVDLGIYIGNYHGFSLPHLESRLPVTYYKDLDALRDAAKQERHSHITSIYPGLLENYLSDAGELDGFRHINEHLEVGARVSALTKDSQLVADFNDFLLDMNPYAAATLSQDHLHQVGESVQMNLGNYNSFLSESERAYMLQHPIVTFALDKSGFEPYTIIEGALQSGYSLDLLKHISDSIGLTFEPQLFDSWELAQQGLQDGEADLLLNLSRRPERESWLEYTNQIGQIRSVMVTRDEQNWDGDLNSLRGLRLAISAGYPLPTFLHPIKDQLEIIEMANSEQAITAIANRQADFLMGDRLNIAWLVAKSKATNLSLHMMGEGEEAKYYHFAASKNHQPLASIINRAIDSLPSSVFHELDRKWTKGLYGLKNDSNQHRNSHLKTIMLLAGITIALSIGLAISMLLRERQRKTNQQVTLALEAAQAAAKEAEQLATAKSNFLARMSHEIRTPMNGVMGMAEALNATRLDPEQADLLNTLNGSARNLMSLLNDVLDFSKMDAQKLQLESRPINLKESLQSVADNFQHKLQSEQITLNVTVHHLLAQAYMGDPTRLMQILNNLMSNAVKFTQQGYIDLRAVLVKRQDHSTDLVRFSIRDTGMGIPKAQQQNLFGAFIQVDTDTTRKFGGTGLGLSIVKELVGLMGGSIEVESTPGIGTLFTVTIPMLKARQPSASALQQPSMQAQSDLSNLRILLAEDTATNRKVILNQLDRIGVKAVEAQDGQEALERFIQGDFNLVLSDCHMPRMDGFTLAKRLRARPDGNQVRLIAITADAMSGAAERYLEAGFDSYLSKPCPYEELKRTLHESSQWLRQQENDAASPTMATTVQSTSEPAAELQPPLAQDSLARTEDSDAPQDGGEEDDLQQYAELMPELFSNTAPAMVEETFILPTDEGTVPAELFQPALLLETSGGCAHTAAAVVSVFLDSCDTDTQQLEQATADEDLPAVKQHAHRLKGNLRYLCGDALDPAAVALEQAAAQAQPRQCKELADSLLARISQLKQELQRWQSDTEKEAV